MIKYKSKDKLLHQYVSLVSPGWRIGCQLYDLTHMLRITAFQIMPSLKRTENVANSIPVLRYITKKDTVPMTRSRSHIGGFMAGKSPASSSLGNMTTIGRM